VLERWRPRALVYVSCNPMSLARDLSILARTRLLGTGHSPYQLAAVQPLDMFPHTPHVETVAILALARARR
jgi:23S rRNA (uracil1939-C5)-methyltransferase